MGGSVRTAVKTGIAAVAVTAVAAAPLVMPLPEARTVAVPSPTSTKYSDTRLTSVASDIAALLAPPVNLVTGAVNGVIGLYYPAIDIADAVVPWVSYGVSFVPVVGPPIAGQININYSLVAGLGNSIAPFATSIVSVPANFLNQVAQGVPVGSALYNQLIDIVDASLALGTGVGVSLYNWGVSELAFFTGIYIPPVALSVPSGVEQQRVTASSVETELKPAQPEGEKITSFQPDGSGPPEGSGTNVPPAGGQGGAPIGGGSPGQQTPGLDVDNGTVGNQNDKNEDKDKDTPPRENQPTTTSAGGVTAQGEVRGGGPLNGNDTHIGAVTGTTPGGGNSNTQPGAGPTIDTPDPQSLTTSQNTAGEADGEPAKPSADNTEN